LNRHLAFGAGPHVCLGAGLARLELEIGLSRLFGRLGDVRLDPANPPRRKCESILLCGFHTLPVVFTPARERTLS
jgi:cytochrome P450 PksS